jgi:hypothetical protein
MAKQPTAPDADAANDLGQSEPTLAELANAVRGNTMSPAAAAARLARQISAGTVTTREAIEAVLPFGVAGLFAEGAVASEAIGRYETLLVDLIESIGIERVVAELEQAARDNEENADDGQLGHWVPSSASEQIRWIGGRRELDVPGADPPFRGSWVAWRVHGIADAAVTLDVLQGELQADAEVQLRAAIEEHRGTAAEPHGGLFTDDELLAGVARRVVGTEYPVAAHGRHATVEDIWIEFRLHLGHQFRQPSWWVRLNAPAVARFLVSAAQVLAAAPWECPGRTAVVVSVAGRCNAIFRPPAETDPVEANQVVFTIGESSEQTGLDLLVVSFVEESFQPTTREQARELLLAGGWKDPRHYPYLQVHRTGVVDVVLDDDDFDLAVVLCQTLVLALATAEKRTEALIERTVTLDDFPELVVKYSVIWFDP